MSIHPPQSSDEDFVEIDERDVEAAVGYAVLCQYPDKKKLITSSQLRTRLNLSDTLAKMSKWRRRFEMVRNVVAMLNIACTTYVACHGTPLTSILVAIAFSAFPKNTPVARSNR